MKTTQIFEAEDGMAFPNAEECRAYEANAVLRQMVGLTIEDVKAAVSYQNKSLAKAIEATARRITAARIEAGDGSPRGRKKAAAPAADASAEPAGEPPSSAETAEEGASEAESSVTTLRSRKKAA